MTVTCSRGCRRREEGSRNPGRTRAAGAPDGPYRARVGLGPHGAQLRCGPFAVGESGPDASLDESDAADVPAADSARTRSRQRVRRAGPSAGSLLGEMRGTMTIGEDNSWTFMTSCSPKLVRKPPGNAPRWPPWSRRGWCSACVRAPRGGGHEPVACFSTPRWFAARHRRLLQSIPSGCGGPVIPDVNVLVAAFRPDHEHHVVAATWPNNARDDCARGDGTLVLPPMVVGGFLRVVTNHRVFIDPDSVQDAIERSSTLCWQPLALKSARPATSGPCCEAN